jgi:hypothetical protein
MTHKASDKGIVLKIGRPVKAAAGKTIVSQKLTRG